MTRFRDLLQGYRRFRGREWQEERDRWSELAEGQSPKVMVIACSDSRVDPASIFDARPGEMFVVRNVANLVPPFEPDLNYHGVSAALEFAVTQLEVDELTRAVRDAVDRLPERCRQAYVLHREQGWSQARVAEIMGKSPGNVRVLQHRGLRRLALLLEAQGVRSQDVTR